MFTAIRILNLRLGASVKTDKIIPYRVLGVDLM
jgi:hypothetical protein